MFSVDLSFKHPVLQLSLNELAIAIGPTFIVAINILFVPNYTLIIDIQPPEIN